MSSDKLYFASVAEANEFIRWFENAYATTNWDRERYESAKSQRKQMELFILFIDENGFPGTLIPCADWDAAENKIKEKVKDQLISQHDWETILHEEGYCKLNDGTTWHIVGVTNE